MKHSCPRPEVVASALCLLAVLLFSAAYLADRPLYMDLLNRMTVAVWPRPFIDWEYVPAFAQCWARGEDVYAATSSCGPVANSPFVYSPLLLRATFLPNSLFWTDAIGLGMAMLFALSLLLLRAPRTWWSVGVMGLATISSATAFALERGNLDVLVFLLAVAGVGLWCRGFGSRLAAYAIFTMAGLLKYYPLVLLALALREKRRDAVLIAAAVALVLAWFVGSYAGEIRAALHGVPTGSPYQFWIGAGNLPAGLAEFVARRAQHLGASPDAPYRGAIMALLCCAVILAGALLATRGGVRRSIDAMPTRDRGMLLAGGLLMEGCFFIGASNGYRAILLLLALPGLLSLSRALPARWARACFWLGSAAVPLVMWSPALKYAIYATGLSRRVESNVSTPGMVHFVLNELAWWWLMALLLSVVASFVLTCVRQTWLPRLRFRAAGRVTPAG